MTQFTREYKSSAAAQSEMAQLARLGFEAAEYTTLEQRPGLGRIAMLGVFAFAFKPKAHVMVIYRGDGPEPSQKQLAYASAALSMERARENWARSWRMFGIGKKRG